jgi:hypothetical protein
VTASKNNQNRAPARSSRIGGRQPCRARHSRSLLLARGPVLVPKDPSRGQRPVPERPWETAMPDFLSKGSRRDGEDRALGVSHAIAAHLAGDCPRQRATTASTHYQQVTRAAGDAYQDPACRASLHVRLHPRIVRDLSPNGDERIPQTLAGHVLPNLAQIARVKPGGGAITLGRHPRDNGHKGRIMGAGQNLRVAQCPQAARGAAGPGDDAIYARHGVAPPSSLAGHGPPSARSGRPAVLALAAPPCNRPGDRPPPRCAQPDVQATGRRPKGAPDGEAPTEALWPLIAYPWRIDPNFTNVCRPGFPAHLHPN